MGEMRKITVDVPADDLAAAQAFTGAGVTETVRAALKKLRSIRAQQDLVRQKPYSGGAWGSLGKVLYAHAFAPQANLCFEKAERYDPQEPRWPYLRALCFLQEDPNINHALPDLKRAATLTGRAVPPVQPVPLAQPVPQACLGQAAARTGCRRRRAVPPAWLAVQSAQAVPAWRFAALSCSRKSSAYPRSTV